MYICIYVFIANSIGRLSVRHTSIPYPKWNNIYIRRDVLRVATAGVVRYSHRPHHTWLAYYRTISAFWIYIHKTIISFLKYSFCSKMSNIYISNVIIYYDTERY
ncbi:uncharacterized protein LOC105665312 isoform X1 [Ceratitis capitata]|uniref:uncharacterized protein LOC105665312 isoform X1 n=1 Tax=Ceratitis capitata TaxID=7213 RepID=UPI000A11D397|nr:uncharacterized protein LOC105665312 isoform X1 [Ceratitis capitata]